MKSMLYIYFFYVYFLQFEDVGHFQWNYFSGRCTLAACSLLAALLGPRVCGRVFTL